MLNRRTFNGLIAITVLAAATVSAQQNGRQPTSPVGSQGSPLIGGASGTQTGGQDRQTSLVQTHERNQITVTGCVMREGEYLKANSGGRGGVGGSGIGSGNEFVLTHATMGAAAASTPATATTDQTASRRQTGTTPSGAAGTGSATGTTGSTAATATAPGATYSLTGSREGDLTIYVGLRVEMTGTLSRAATTRGAASPSGGPSLQTLEIMSVRLTGPTCQ